MASPVDVHFEPSEENELGLALDRIEVAEFGLAEIRHPPLDC